MTNMLKLFCSTLAFGASSTAMAVIVAVCGLWLIGAIDGKRTAMLQEATSQIVQLP